MSNHSAQVAGGCLALILWLAFLIALACGAVYLLINVAQAALQ